MNRPPLRLRHIPQRAVVPVFRVLVRLAEAGGACVLAGQPVEHTAAAAAVAVAGVDPRLWPSCDWVWWGCLWLHCLCSAFLRVAGFVSQFWLYVVSVGLWKTHAVLHRLEPFSLLGQLLFFWLSILLRLLLSWL